jgi:thiol:disulfide interchange protein DsbC
MKYTLPVLVFLLACAGCASAEDPELDKVRKSVAKNLPGVPPESVVPSNAPGLYQVQKGASFGYITRDGRYLIQGDMFDLVTGEEITEKIRENARLSVLKQFGPDQVIEFGPKDGAPKHWVTVFTDVDCGYCRKLHNEMAQYNAQGIGVRYLFFPRSGPNTPSFAKAEEVWCSGDRKEALTQAKRGQRINASTSCPNPIQAHYDAGEALGINATPMIVLPSGEIVRGYVPPTALAARLAGPLKAALQP